MVCPKCKSKIGLHRYESWIQVHLAQGAACCVCGYWMEGSARLEKQVAQPAGKKLKRR